MRGSDFHELRSFLEIAERQSFAKAAAHLAVTPSALSQTLKKLESRLGVQLVNRTTRRVSLTDAGVRLYEEIREAMSVLTKATHSLDAYRDGSQGHVRLTASRVAIDGFLRPRLAEMRKRFPRITLEIDVNNRFVDLVEARMDLGIRRGEFLSAETFGRRLTADERFVAIASPSYLARMGTPQVPSDLGHHDCIRLRALRGGRLSPWRFVGASGSLFEQEVEGTLVVNDARLALDAARAGLGIAFLAESFVATSAARSDVEIVLANASPRRAGLYVYCLGTEVPQGAIGSIFTFLAHEAANVGTPGFLSITSHGVNERADCLASCRSLGLVP